MGKKGVSCTRVVMRSTHPPFGQVQACENRGWGMMRRRVNPPHPFPTICSIFCCCFCAKGWERWLAAFWLEGEKKQNKIDQYTVYSKNNKINAENLSNVIKNWTFLPHPLSNLTSRLFWHRRQRDIIHHGWLVVCRVSQLLSQGRGGSVRCNQKGVAEQQHQKGDFRTMQNKRPGSGWGRGPLFPLA